MTMARLREIFLYDDPDTAALDVDYLVGWLGAQLPQTRVSSRTDYLTHQLARFRDAERDVLVEQLCEQLQHAEVDNLVRPQDRERLPEMPPGERGLDVVYEAEALQLLLGLLIDPAEAGLSHLHVMFTSNFIGDWREGEAYLHLRTAVLGNLNIISTSGLVEALELPKQYHFMRQQVAVLGLEEEDVDSTFASQTLGYGDPRLNEVCKGYLMQAVFYRLQGETGCDEPRCRLYLNPTHTATLKTQVMGRGRLCERHLHDFRTHGGEPE